MSKRVHLNLVIDLVVDAPAFSHVHVVRAEAAHAKLVLKLGLVVKCGWLGRLGLYRRYGLHGWDAGGCRLILGWLRSGQFLSHGVILALLEHRCALFAL